MIFFVFDLDDTLLFHQNNIHYNYICENVELSYYLDKLQYPKYILTNGTNGHANLILTNMKIKDKFQTIYARDTMEYNKPHPYSYKIVTDNIIQTNQEHFKGNHTKNIILFFDDLLENLQEANNHNWITIWIHPNSHQSSQYEYVDYAFPNILTALIHFNKKR